MGYASKLNMGAIKFGSILKTSKNRKISFVCLTVFINKQDPKKQMREDQDESQGRKKKEIRRKNYKKRDPQSKSTNNQRFSDVFCKE